MGLIASEDKESSVSTENPLNKLNPNLCNLSFKNHFCFWARIVSQKLTSGSVLRVEDVLHKSTLSDKPCPRLLSYYQKFVDEQSKKAIKDLLVQHDRTLLVADPRRCESKKFGGPGARARFQKSYR